ncbi:C4-dicarboxylate ABC transporter [Devosia epidermidihirudinis]|uniref:C4-dicarboxylate ABC transporter n=1 Tax=Devosia epidermidihirudinis TaxID=1293439 RepID=A0A0F5Q389_9HYPH|nr:TDT family transporter [Devosia epidermidihirudinis]KKC35393.1 C4-dicarboxylate ABC transporter [Devosia epidermidihirudinis]
MTIDFPALRPLTSLSSPRDLVRLFTPNWFAVSMGTGIVAVALGQFPQVPLLFKTGMGIWVFTMVLFALSVVMYGARWVIFFEGAKRILSHSSMSMFLGCIPMALATVGNGMVIYGVPALGDVAIDIAFGMWWFDASLAFACGIGVPFFMFTRQHHTHDQMTAIWLLPVVACGVAASSGALLLPDLAADTHLAVLFVCFALWACSVPLAMGLIVMLVVRMIVHKLPHVSMAASSWLALGPIASGALGLLLLSQSAPAVLAANGLAPFADALGGASLLAGILLWGFGFWWLFLATLITIRYFTEPVPFNLGWWAYTFPLGVYAVATLKLAHIIPLSPIAWFGAVLVVALIIAWLIVALRTVSGGWRGDLFNSPCIADD